MSGKLRVLAQHRDTLLLAEVAGLLHDIGKFCNCHIEHHCGGERKWSNKYAYKAVVDEPKKFIRLSKKANNLPKPDALKKVLNAQSPKAADFLNSTTKEALEKTSIKVLDEEYTLGELIMLGEPSFAAHEQRAQLLDGKDGWLAALLGVCHSEAHHDKQEPRQDPTHAQKIPARISSPFGHEHQTVVTDDSDKSLDTRLKNLPITSSTLTSRAVIDRVLEEFKVGLGDTRRPINEVTLADWAATVAALLKAAVAATVLTSNKPAIGKWKEPMVIDHCIRWRHLRISFNGLAFLHAPSVPDLLGRQEALKAALDKVKKLLEDDYPLGNEVYRDENGSIFVLPDIADILDYVNEDNKSLRALIQEQMGFDGELVVTPVLDQQSWWAQGPDRDRADEIPPIADHLKSTPLSSADPAQAAQWWTGKSADICAVCGIRPQGPAQKAADRKVCQTCEKRRSKRSQEWMGKLSETIWLDEVADANGRICLVAGQFALGDWLRPDGFVKTLLVSTPDASGGPVLKNPSFARLRRIWETTRQFWQDITDESDNDGVIGRVCPRLRIHGTFEDGHQGLDPTHAYEILLEDIRLSIVCVREDEFLVTENLEYIARLLNEPCTTYQDAADCVRTRLLNNGVFPVEEPTGYGSPNKLRGKLRITDVKPEVTPYLPAIPILAEPRTFMALVPADKALAVAKAIRAKYECEMGKVHNRLPLNLGLVFAGRRTPLAAILDAGRRMVLMGSSDGTVRSERWKVEEKIDGEPVSQTDPQPRAVTLTLGKDGRTLSLSVPTVMGDKSTPDAWYPYWCVESDTSGNKPAERQLQFTGPDGKEWVHVCKLKEGDTVAFMPSRFDFVFLDTAARRFEVSYAQGAQGNDGQQQQGQRPGDRDKWLRRRGPAGRTRPYYLEKLGELTARCDKPAGAGTGTPPVVTTPQPSDRDSLWDILADGLATTQIHHLVGLIETKRQEWQLDEDPSEQSKQWRLFKQFVDDAIRNANWQKAGPPTGHKLQQLRDAAIRGQLADVVELHAQVLKRKSAVDPQGGSE